VADDSIVHGANERLAHSRYHRHRHRQPLLRRHHHHLRRLRRRRLKQHFEICLVLLLR